VSSKEESRVLCGLITCSLNYSSSKSFIDFDNSRDINLSKCINTIDNVALKSLKVSWAFTKYVEKAVSSLLASNVSFTRLKNFKFYARLLHAQIHSELPCPELVNSYIRLFNFILIEFIFNIRYLTLPSAAQVAHLSMISHIGSIISRVFSGSSHYRLFRSLWISTGLASTP